MKRIWVALLLFETYGHKKKGQRLDPTFVNLKSNTMKNTLQRYGLQ